MNKALFLAAGVALCLGPAAHAEPIVGGDLVAASDLEPVSLDPIFGNAPSIDGNYYNLFYDNLFYLDSDSMMQPELATSWTIADDGSSMTLQLREGVTFHDGTPFNADAVEFSLERAIDPDLNAPHSTDIAAVSSVDVLSEFEVRINFDGFNGAVIPGLANEAGMIVSPAAASTEGFARNPVGTGPFRFVEWRSGDRIMAERNPDYWRTDAEGRALPFLNTVTIRIIPNTAVKILEVRSGEVQLVDTVQVQDFPAIEEAEGIELIEKPTGIHQFLAFNTSRPPFDNADLRRAVLMAIDRGAIEQVVSQGFGVLTPTLVPPAEFIFDGDLEPTAFDLDGAIAAREALGFTDTITVSVIQRDPDTQIAQIIQAMLTQAGYDVNVEILERGAWVDNVRAENHEIGLLRINVPRIDPSQIFTSLMGRNAGINFAAYSNDELFDLIDAAHTEVDRDERRDLYVRVQEHLLEEAVYGFLFLRPIRDVAAENLEALRREASGTWLLEEAYFTE
ncbi:MAG: ABC transporter substrate-binding protein [Pseudomonadota bacterium]